MILFEDLLIETKTEDRRGGQHVGMQPVTVIVTHVPSGITASVCQRSQLKARNIAISMIEAALTHPDYR